MITAKKFIEIPEVTKYFGDNFIKPKGINSRPVIVASGDSPQLVGTALDISLKIFLARKFGNPFPTSDCTIHPSFEVDELSDTYIRNLIDELNTEFENNNIKHKNLIEASLIFALNDSFIKSGILPRDSWEEYYHLIPEITALFENSLNTFAPFKEVIISPELTDLVPGLIAEADIIIDGALIDIKTVNEKGIKKKDYNRLVLYYILCKMHPQLKDKVNKFGFFFSRQSSLEVFEPVEIMDLNQISHFQKQIKSFVDDISFVEESFPGTYELGEK